ncbi:MAG: TolC family protein [Myxococcales bacterium]|nr:TolC family protein [Myxococcales bacterium]
MRAYVFVTAAVLGPVSLTSLAAEERATQAQPAMAPPSALKVLSLQDALQTAKEHQPQLLLARAQTMAARARADQARAPILPQLTGTASYQRTTANFVARPGAVPSQFASSATAISLDTFNFFSFGMQLSQYIWDFGQTTRRWQAASASADAQHASEQVTALQIATTVQNAYFAARAQRALLQVARDNLANQDRHLVQVTAFVSVGTRPEIDLAQARTDRANASVQVIASENSYEIAKAQLRAAMGVEDSVDFDVQDEQLPPVPGEDQPTEELLPTALAERPEFLVLSRQLAAQKLLLSAAKGGYGPSLGATMSLTDAGTNISQLALNLSASVNLSWPIFQGLLTLSQVKEQSANLTALDAQLQSLRQQVRVELSSARLQVRASKATCVAVQQAQQSAGERLRLAEARYRTGVGSMIELGDAQLAFTTASAQLVQAEYALASARAQLLRALGQPIGQPLGQPIGQPVRP